MTAIDHHRAWTRWAMGMIAADFHRSADTHLLPVHLPACPGVRLYLKDESTHVTGSLKHRLARALFLYALVNGWLHEGTPVVEASSGSTAISEAYFARMLGLPFVAVVPTTTSKEKIALIESFGARCHMVDDPKSVYAVAARIAAETHGHYMDQFTFSERATDWRGNNNIAETIFTQMSEETHPVPRWIVVGAGTGGTATTLGRYIRYQGHDTDLCVVDPEHSVTFDYFRTGDSSLTLERGSGVEGIGRPRVEPSFIRTVVNRMIKVPDAASYAAMFFLYELIGRRAGPSTGTNLCGAFQLIAEMVRSGEQGSVVTLICDSGDRYLRTYYDDAWMAQRKIDLRPWLRQLARFHESGAWDSQLPQATLEIGLKPHDSHRPG
jgi:cysteine synthase A